MTASFDIEITRDWSSFGPRWEALTAGSRASPFQKAAWLAPWYAAFPVSAGVRPLLVAVRDRATGRDVLLLPFVERSAGALRIVEFADLDVTDCNAPAIAPELLADPGAAADAIEAVRRALPPCDVLRLTKMPASIGARANPLACPPDEPIRPSMSGATPSWSLHVSGSWDDYLHKTLDRYTRKELGRSLRLCEQKGPTRIVRATTAEAGRAILATIDALQRERLEARHMRHVFDDPATRAFYASLVDNGIARGETIVAGLEIGGEITAGVFGVIDKPRVTVLRIANRGGDYARLGLGRVLLAELFRILHAEGFTHFDLSIGDGEHKRRLGANPEMLIERIEAMSWRGGTAIAASRAKTTLKQRLPGLAALVGRLRKVRHPAAGQPSD